LRVALRRGKAGVAQQFLDRAQVGAGAQHGSERETVAAEATSQGP
jgi:hypothetical protein